MAKDPTSAYINYLLSENCYLQTQCDELSEMLQSAQSNVHSLNTFIETAYDISSNHSNGVNVVTYDSCGNELACLIADGYGGFIPCTRDFSDNILPCVPPRILGTRDINPSKKRGIYDYPPYYSPYFPYYPSYYNPYYASYYNPYYYNPYWSKYPYTSTSPSNGE